MEGNNGTLDCEISIHAVIEVDDADFQCLDTTHIPQVVIYSHMEMDGGDGEDGGDGGDGGEPG